MRPIVIPSYINVFETRKVSLFMSEQIAFVFVKILLMLLISAKLKIFMLHKPNGF